MQSENILVMQTSFIGDVVLATSLIETLHSEWPNAHIDILVRKGNEGLFQGHPFIREVLIWDKKTKKYLNWWSLLLKIRKKSYDRVINLQRFFASGLLCGLSKSKERIGFSENPLSFLFTSKTKYGFDRNKLNIHEIERNYQLIASKVKQKISNMRLYPSEKDFEKVKNFKLTKYIVVCPASVWFTKQLPREKWVTLIDQMPVAWDVYLLGGNGDYELCEWVRNLTHNHSVRNLAGQLSFLESAALMQDAEMNYANDSGPMHIASAVQAKVTAMFLSTVPAFGFGPLSPNSRIAETKDKLACRPCGIHGSTECPEGHFRCSEIEMADLVPATDEVKYRNF